MTTGLFAMHFSIMLRNRLSLSYIVEPEDVTTFDNDAQISLQIAISAHLTNKTSSMVAS
jgi:hypothetical protein